MGQQGKTAVSIIGNKWCINKKIINAGSHAEGLLMNVRMVNSVFEDRGDRMPAQFGDFNPDKNTDTFISKISEYVAYGVNAFTISLQGGAPDYEGAINSAFESDGSLREEYMNRVAKVIKAADQNSAIIILSCFYQRQHSYSSALSGKESIMKALANTVKWIKNNDFRNVVLEVSNEYRHGGYLNWKDGKWIISKKGQLELLTLAKSLDPDLLVSTSGMGEGQMDESLVKSVDFITIHFNTTSLDNYVRKINKIKEAGKPVLCNEDDKTGQDGASALMLSVLNGCGWGYMNNRQNQYMPLRFEGYIDDTIVYKMMKRSITPGLSLDKNSLTQPSIIITYPNDGDVFKFGQAINIKFSYLFADKTEKRIIHLFTNNKEAGITGTGQNQFCLNLREKGIIYLNMVVTDEKGKEILRSRKVDIIIKD